MVENNGTFRRRFGKGILLAVIILLVSIILARLVYQLFSIQVIEVDGSNVRVLIDQNKIPKNLLFFPSEKMRSDIVANNLLLTDVHFIKRYPHTLIIVPVPRTPYIRVDNGQRKVYVDQTGIVLGDVDGTSQLPVLELSNIVIHTGEKLTDSRMPFLLDFIGRSHDLFSISSITNTNDGQFLVKTDKTDIYITQGKQPSETLATLQTLIAGFRIKGTLPSVVDLRFDKPVVKF